MGEVLAFFAFLFAIFRVCVRIGADGHDKRVERRVGTAQEYFDKWCDQDMEKELSSKLHSKEYYESTWQTLEHVWETRRDEIDNSTERAKKIWHVLMEGGRKPFYMYEPEFLREQGFNFWSIEPYNYRYAYIKESYCMPTRFRAVYCLMWLQGKKPKREAQKEYSMLYGIYPNPDLMTDPLWGSKEYYCFENLNIPW